MAKITMCVPTIHRKLASLNVRTYQMLSLLTFHYYFSGCLTAPS